MPELPSATPNKGGRREPAFRLTQPMLHSERNEADEILLTKRPSDRRVERPPANSAKSQDFADRTDWQNPPPAAALMLFSQANR